MASEIVIPEKERWTYSDYMNLTPPDSFGFQVIRGELIVSPSPKRNHQWCIQKLLVLLDGYVTKQKLGEVFVAPFDVVLDAHLPEPENIVQPDVVFVSNERIDIVTEENIKGAPDLVVEVLLGSTARYDRVGKMEIYAEFGVREYWILDADAKVLEVFDVTHERPHLMMSLADADVFRPNLFPDLEIPLENLWYPNKEDGQKND